MSDINKNNPIDLGSDHPENFNPFANDDDFEDGITADETTDTPTTQTDKAAAQTIAPGNVSCSLVNSGARENVSPCSFTSAIARCTVLLLHPQLAAMLRRLIP